MGEGGNRVLVAAEKKLLAQCLLPELEGGWWWNNYVHLLGMAGLGAQDRWEGTVGTSQDTSSRTEFLSYHGDFEIHSEISVC